MEMQEDEIDENYKDKKETLNLTLRKPKTIKKTKQNDNFDLLKEQKSFNELLPGEIEIKNEDIILSNKKRLRDYSSSLINMNDSNNSNFIIKERTINQEDKILSEKALEIFKALQITPNPGIKEGDYDIEFHNKRESIVKEILMDEDMMMKQRKLSYKTGNIDIYCTSLNNFNIFCFYNNNFKINSYNCLDKIVENAFSFEEKNKSIPLALKFANSVFEFGFLEEFHQKYIDFFIKIFLDENKMKDINSIPKVKIYLYNIIYLIFKDSLENIKIEKEIFQKFILKILFGLNIYDNELNQIIVKLISALYDNILYPKIIKKEVIYISICAEINKYMFKLISETIKNLGQNNLYKIICDENLNFIIKQSFNIIVKIISGLNLKYQNDISFQEFLINKENKQFFYEFVLSFSNLNLSEKNFLWLLDIIVKFEEIRYYSDIYLKTDIKNNIFEKFISRKSNICEIFHFMRSLVETASLFNFYSSCDQFYKCLKDLDIDKSPFLSSIHYMFVIKELLDRGEEKKCLDNIYDRLCIIQAKEKIEQIYYKFGSDDSIHQKYNEIIQKLDELNEKIQID